MDILKADITQTVLMMLPTLIESDAELAKQYARDWIRRCAREDWLHIGVPMLNPDAGHAQVRQLLKRLALSHPFALYQVIADARAGWEDADLALRELIAEMADRGNDLPAQLRAYIIELIHPHRSQVRGPQRASHILQDIAVAALVEDMVNRFSTIRPTGHSPRKTTICKIVATALTEARLGRSISADAVKKTWRKYRFALAPDINSFNSLPGEK